MRLLYLYGALDVIAMCFVARRCIIYGHYKMQRMIYSNSFSKYNYTHACAQIYAEKNMIYVVCMMIYCETNLNNTPTIESITRSDNAYVKESYIVL